jgi:hypothetical protein
MSIRCVTRHLSRSFLITVIALLVLGSGCSQRAAGVKAPSIDAFAVAARALARYDSNNDGALDRNELTKCPPLAVAITKYDADKDGRLTGDEITKRIGAIAGPTSAYVSIACTVFLEGRPLDGAQVKLRPVDIFGDEISAAEGATDPSGVAHPSISADMLPPKLAGASLVYPGLYLVEITHPQTQLPARYNTATELGCEVDPSAREGTAARFDLKSN